VAYVKTHVVVRRNACGGRSAAEHLVAALRCLYRHAQDDGLITEVDNPARKVAKPRRLPSTRRAVPDARLAEINQVAANTGDDPDLDSLLLRLHTETACRRGGALALRPRDPDPDQCLILLREKGETVRWHPASPTLSRVSDQPAAHGAGRPRTGAVQAVGVPGRGMTCPVSADAPVPGPVALQAGTFRSGTRRGPVVVTIQLSRCLMAISAEIAGYMAISPLFGHGRITVTATRADRVGGRWF
jgi:hypothetical protein